MNHGIHIFVQTTASALSNVGLILSGMTLGYPSTVLPSLLSHSGSQFHVDIDQASWIGRFFLLFG